MSTLTGMTYKMAEKIADKIIDDLNDRRGCGIDSLDDDIQKDIRETWANIILVSSTAES